MTEPTVRKAKRTAVRPAPDVADAEPRTDTAPSATAAQTLPPDFASHAAINETILPSLHEVLAALAGGENRDTTLHLLTEKAQLLTGCASAAIALLDSGGETVSFVAASGQEVEELPGSRVHIADTVAGKTARTGEPYLAYRPMSTASLTNGAASNSVSSAAVLPIFDKGHPIGAFAALNKANGKAFDGTDYLCLSTLAAAAAVVLTNTRLRAEEQRQGRELAILYEAVRRVSGQLSVQEVLQAVVEQTAAHLESNRVILLLLNDERTHLYIAADAGLTEEEREITIPTDAPIGTFLLSCLQPVQLAFRDDDMPPFTPPPGTVLCQSLFPDRITRNGLLAPIRSGEIIHGFALALSGQPPGSYTASDANFLAALTAQAAVGLENAWLYEDANRRAEEATALYELSQAVSATLDLQEVLERVAESVLTLLR
jgi:GAF domain-containing protein